MAPNKKWKEAVIRVNKEYYRRVIQRIVQI